MSQVQRSRTRTRSAAWWFRSLFACACIAGATSIAWAFDPKIAFRGLAAPPVASPTSVAATGPVDREVAPSRSALIDAFVSEPVGTVPLAEFTGEVRAYHLEIHEIDAEIAPGVVVRQWAFGLAGQAPSVPGPELRARQGDLVRITLTNHHHEPHSLHLHGITSLAQEMDGVPHTSRHVLPGESFTYTFVATEPGTHAYHCHVNTNLHMDMGMYGAVVIEPRDPEVPWDHEVTLVLDEWDSRQDPEALVHRSEPDHFLVNGRSYPNIPPVVIPEGEVALVRFVNMGYEPHSLHLHGSSFLVIAKDGYDLPLPWEGDTLPILPGERYDLLIRGRDGTFPFHDHIVSNVTNAGVYPGGMHFMVVGGPARDAHGRGLGSGGHAEHAHRNDGASTSVGAGHFQASPGASIGAGEPTTTADAARDQRERVAAVDPAMLPLLAGQATVRIVDFAFDAPVLRIAAGTTVTWVNETRAAHTITHGDPEAPLELRDFDSATEVPGRITLLRSGQRWSHTFDVPGEYWYYCQPHKWMVGRIVVE